MAKNSIDMESLDSEEDKQGLLDPSSRSVRRWSNYASHSGRWHAIHLFVLYVINLILVITLLWSMLRRKDPSMAIYCQFFSVVLNWWIAAYWVMKIAPADPAISYKTTIFTPGQPHNPSPYQGEPTPEKNKLWEDLYVGKRLSARNDSLTKLGIGASRVTKEETGKMMNKTYELPDTDGDHIITIEVFHQLHCLVTSSCVLLFLFLSSFSEYSASCHMARAFSRPSFDGTRWEENFWKSRTCRP